MSPCPLASPLMAYRKRRRGSGARDLTNSSTWVATRTLVFIQTGSVLELAPARRVIPQRFYGFGIAHDFKRLDNGLHPFP